MFDTGLQQQRESRLEAERRQVKSAPRYGISRIDDPEHRTHAWRVSLQRRGKSLVKNFPDIKHGGKRKALQAAKVHRDRLLEQYAPLSRVEFASTMRSNNKSGVSGVCLVSCKYSLVSGEERRIWYWEATWPTTPGEHINKRFSVSRYGKRRAFDMACHARAEGMQKVKGVFWATARGMRP